MSAGLKEILTKHAGKSISLGTLAVALVIAQTIVQYGDTRWSMAAETQQTQQVMESHIEDGLEDSIMIINMKQAGATQAQIDAALLKTYEARLQAMRDKRNNQ